MEKVAEFLRELWMLVCGVCSYAFGGLDGLLGALIAFVILDYVTGFSAAIYNKNLSSAVGFKGILRKAVLFSVVAVAKIVGVDILNVGFIVRDAVIAFYLFNEGVSILENCKLMDLPVPDAILNYLKKVKNKFKIDDDNSDTDDKK